MPQTTLPPSCTYRLETWKLSLLAPSGPVQACTGIALKALLFTSSSEEIVTVI